MASIYRRGKIWWGRVERNGRLLRHPLKTTSKKLARSRLTKWLAELEGLKFGERPERSFDFAVERFVKNHLPAIKPRAADRYAVSLDALSRTCAGLSLGQIGSATMMAFVNLRREDGVTPGTIRRDLSCLSSVMAFAVEEEWIDANPVPAFMKRMQKRWLREAEPRKRYLTHEEERRLLESASPAVARAIAFAIDTGLRREEQFDLRWEQVDLRKVEISIWSATAKNSKSRAVPILPRARTILAEMPRNIALPYVFWHTDKRRRVKRLGNMNKGLKAAARRAGLPDLRWHDLRRTCGCRLLQDHGLSMTGVRDWLGHSSVTVTEKAYAFLKTEHLHAATGTKTGTSPKQE